MSLVRLGVSACFFHADAQRKIFKGKTLLYAEESMLRWLMSQGVVPFLLPRASGSLTLHDFVDSIDGLVLQGGSDMSPTHYGEQPVRPEWEGDYVRDLYEMELIKACMVQNKPVLGICRGLQVINVCFGGSLWQDIPTMHPKGQVHRSQELYDQLFHDVTLKSGGWLSRAYGDVRTARVNTVHHQGIKQLGRDLVVEATSPHDELIEAIRYRGPLGDERQPFVVGVQWHPEFQSAEDESLLSSRVLLSSFIDEVRARRTRHFD